MIPRVCCRLLLLLFLSILVAETESFVHHGPSSQQHYSRSIIRYGAASDDNEYYDDNSNFMASLNARLEEVRSTERLLPLVVLDCMLPRQVMRLCSNDPQLIKVVRKQLRNESPKFLVRGTHKDPNFLIPADKTKKMLTGVEVEIIEKPQFIMEGTRVLLILKALRRFRIVSEYENGEDGVTYAQVKYLNSEEEEREELRDSHDKMCIARATLMATELDSLIVKWIELARLNEKRKGQIDMLLDDLGQIPSSDQPSEKAFYTGALINPLPEMGVATGVRPQLLMATTAEKRIEIAYNGILRSIKHMDGSSPLW